MIAIPRRWLLGTLIVLVVAVVAFTTWRLSLGNSNRARLKAIADRGEPVDAFALDLSYRSVPDAENAALLWISGVGQMSADARNQNTWGKFKLPARGTNFSSEQLEFAREMVASNAAALAAFRQAVGLSKSRYPVNLTLGINTLLPHLAQLRSAARLLQAEVVVAVENRDSQRATDALKTMSAAARSLSPEPLLISQLVLYALDTMTFTTAKYTLNHLALSEPQLASLAACFAAADESNSLSRALMGERANFVSIGKDPQTFLASTRPGPPSHTMADTLQQLAWPIIRGSGFLERDFGFGIDALTTNIAFARLPDPARFQSGTNWDAVVETRARERRYLLSGLLLPALGKSVNKDTEARARARIAQTAMAIERYRLAHNGALPANIAAIVPTYLSKIPIDPFDGHPLRFKQLESGYIVYSVGPDTTDDGGIEKAPKRKEKDPWDVTFTVERPPTAAQ